jgi:outer membrane protein
MYKNLILTFFACILMCNGIFAQETWSLEKCVRYALQENINIKRAEISVRSNQLSEKGSKYNRLPSLNGRIGGGYQFGRTIDPVTNAFNSLSIGTNSLSLDLGVTLYNGGRIENSIKQASYDLQAAMGDLAQTKNDISLLIAQSYLNVLFAEEQLDAAVKRKELTESQLSQVDKLIRAGARPQNDRLEILATIARNDQAIIAQENAVETGLLSLKNLLQLDPSTDIQLEKPNTIVISADDNPDALDLGDLYNSSIASQPFIKADENRVKSAALGKNIARANLLPRLSAFAGLSANYSTRGKRLDGTSSTVLIPQTVFIDGAQVDFALEQGFDNFEDNPYFDQLNENFGKSIGLSLNIPIYNNHATIIAMDQAELNMINTQYTSEINKQNLKNDIQTSLANARAAKRTLAASNRTVEASAAAFQNSEKQFQLGTINTFEYATAKNNLDQAEVDLIIAKYDYLFKLKVLDFYQGKKLELR